MLGIEQFKKLQELKVSVIESINLNSYKKVINFQMKGINKMTKEQFERAT